MQDDENLQKYDYFLSMVPDIFLQDRDQKPYPYLYRVREKAQTTQRAFQAIGEWTPKPAALMGDALRGFLDGSDLKSQLSYFLSRLLPRLQ